MADLIEARTASAASPPFAMQARRVGDYILGRQLGSGGMGVVYEAQQVSLRRKVAIKLIRDSQVASPTLLRRFTIEAEATARLNHPNIVAIHEIGEADGQPYFSMELIEGESLRAQIARGEFAGKKEEGSNARSAQARIARLLARTARAVHHAHQRGVLHRDIKPSNILIDLEGEPHLTDFGLAKILRQTPDQSSRLSLTAPDDIAGTPSYMSPEQTSSAPATMASDIYGLGAVLYELLAGRPPFRGPTPLETLKMVQQQPPKRPRAINRLIERDLETICLKCLEKNAHHRYGSAEALAEDLERWTDRKSIKARPAGPLRRVTQWMKRNPVGTAFMASLGLGLFVALLLLNRVYNQNVLSESLRAMLFDETISRLGTWNESNEVTIESRYLAALADRSPNYGARGRPVSLGVSIEGDPVAFAQGPAKLFGLLETSLSQSLGKPVLLDLKLFKRSGRDAQMLAQGRADFMVVDPFVYLEAKASNPAVTPVARDNGEAHGVIVTSTNSGLTRLPRLVGKSIAFPEANDPLTILAKARLVEAGVLAKHLALVTDCVPQAESVSAIGRQLSRRETLVGVLDGQFDAAVTTARRFELEKHRGLVRLDDLPDTPNIFAARPGLPTNLVAAFRAALTNTPAELSPGPTENFEWEGPFRGAVAIDDSWFDAFREVRRNAARFDGRPDLFPPAQSAPANPR